MNTFFTTEAGTNIPRTTRAWLVFLAKALLLICLLYIQFRYPSLNSRYWATNILEAFLLLVTVNLFVDFFRITLIGFYIRRHHLPPDTRDNFVVGINQVASIGSLVAIVVSFLTLFNIGLREALTAISIVAAAMAILFKDYIANAINGMIIMFSDQISLEDYVKIGSQKGKVSDITLLNLHLINDDDEVIYIPNNRVMDTEVVNYTKRSVKTISTEFEVTIKNLRNLRALEQYLSQGMGEFDDLIVTESYTLKTVEVRKEAALLKFQYSFRAEPDNNVERNVRRLILRKVIEFIGQQGAE
ncbi:MAG: mechanosensitive ion channel [Bacteroidia bacterium]|nr:mechanosensitive ion channel [Bacteroidia bacterium]